MIIIVILELIADCHILFLFGIMHAGDGIGIDDALIILGLVASKIFHLQLSVIGLELSRLLDLLCAGAVVWTADALHIGRKRLLCDSLGCGCCHHHCLVYFVEGSHLFVWIVDG